MSTTCARLLPLALVLLAGSASALDLAGYTIGAPLTPAERGAISRNAPGGIGCDETHCTGPIDLGDVQGTITVTCDGSGRIARVLVETDARDYRALLRSAVAKYGKPTERAKGTVENGFGATHASEIVAWHRRDGNVLLSEHFGVVDKSAITASAPGYKAQEPKIKL